MKGVPTGAKRLPILRQEPCVCSRIASALSSSSTECLYVDVAAKQIAAHTFSDDNMMRFGDKWLIKEMKAGPVPEL
jgi:hypothetical protein